jgi:hypothetical protein
MNHAGDEQSPAEGASPFLPTEVEYSRPADERSHGYRPAEGASPFLPTEVEYSRPADESTRGYPPAEGASPLLPTEVEPPFPSAHAGPASQPTRTGRAVPASELTRFGPGVPPPSPAGTMHTAERVWRTGLADDLPRRPRRWRGRAGAVLTVILLAASAVVLYLRFHHAPFHVTGVAITQRTPSGCGVDVTGQVSTNGAAGTVSYQWLFQPDQQAPQPLSQSVTAGQNAVYVTVAVQGSGHGSASRTVTLQILSPDFRTVSTSVRLRC